LIVFFIILLYGYLDTAYNGHVPVTAENKITYTFVFEPKHTLRTVSKELLSSFSTTLKFPEVAIVSEFTSVKHPKRLERFTLLTWVMSRENDLNNVAV
jgi:hypothetical protein